ncbi:MAG TPA: glycosyltransferase [Leucothrix mucor]|nr:glycosyltransferase [Leucothrix mucor]
MKFGVIITTYNSPAWLEKVLWGYENQTDPNFEVIIADDGSGDETTAVIEKFRVRNKLKILHIWHKDEGFRKTKILNKAVQATACGYLMFTDGDCIPRNDTVAVHKIHAKKGRFCSAGYFKLTMSISELVTEDHIKSGDIFDQQWLMSKGQPKNSKFLKLTATGFKQKALNFLTPTKETWNGANSSAFKADILAVNGFDERMQYGGLDRELGERMENNGIQGMQIRYSTVCVHLDHKRGYSSPEIWEKNKRIRKAVKKNKATWTKYGLIKR